MVKGYTMIRNEIWDVFASGILSPKEIKVMASIIRWTACCQVKERDRLLKAVMDETGIAYRTLLWIVKGLAEKGFIDLIRKSPDVKPRIIRFDQERFLKAAEEKLRSRTMLTMCRNTEERPEKRWDSVLEFEGIG